MFTIIRSVYINTIIKKKIKNDFPNRLDSIKNLERKDYIKISNDFISYGAFINFCVSEKISVKSKQRRELLNTFIQKQKYIK